MKLILILRPLEGGGERRENTFLYSAFGCDVDIGSCEHQYSQADPKPMFKVIFIVYSQTESFCFGKKARTCLIGISEDVQTALDLIVIEDL